MGFPLDISLYRVLLWMGSTVSELLSNPLGYKKNPKKLKCTHAESDSDNDSDQTLFPKFIVLESMEETPITKLSPFITEKSFTL